MKIDEFGKILSIDDRCFEVFRVKSLVGLNFCWFMSYYSADFLYNKFGNPPFLNLAKHKVTIQWVENHTYEDLRPIVYYSRLKLVKSDEKDYEIEVLTMQAWKYDTLMYHKELYGSILYSGKDTFKKVMYESKLRYQLSELLAIHERKKVEARELL